MRFDGGSELDAFGGFGPRRGKLRVQRLRFGVACVERLIARFGLRRDASEFGGMRGDCAVALFEFLRMRAA